MLQPAEIITPLPPETSELESVEIFKAMIVANKFLAELKGIARALPNQGILIDTLYLTEGGASSEIENIVTTQDELFRAQLFPQDQRSPAQKEVERYRETLHLGFERLKENNTITNNHLIEMFQTLKGNTGGFRNTPGTELKNDLTGNTVYVPPQNPDTIIAHMSQLERFINEESVSDLDPLIKMALIHHQFESIHPFSDGNGRLGRILNILYLVKSGLLDIPILYMSGYINRTKNEYYRLLQKVREDNLWQEWILYIIKGIAETSKNTLNMVKSLITIMAEYKKRMRSNLPKIYSQDLINNIFRYPYTRIECVMRDLKISRITASKYLERLAEEKFLVREKSGRNLYYVNTPLLQLLRTLAEA